MKKKIEFKLDESLFNKYKSHCDKNGYDMSKRLRLFIESEIPAEYDLIQIEDIFFEPTDSEIEVKNIMGINYPFIKSKPNIFVIKSNSEITNNIEFYHNDKKYKLENAAIVKKEESKMLIECRKWIVEFVG